MVEWLYMKEQPLDLKVNILKKEKIEEAYPGMSPEVYENQLCEIAKEIIQTENDIGRGKSADVFKDPIKTNNLCYKFLNRQEPMDHDPEDEASFMIELEDIHPNVKVPNPLASIVVRKVFDEKLKRFVTKKVLVMEKINGPSLQNMYDDPKLIPATYNHEDFFDNLESFILLMHKKGIHHRDLHLGNIMCDIKTGMPRVIDFGRSTKVSFSEETPYKQEYLILDKETSQFKEETKLFTPDLDFLKKDKSLMAEKL